MADSMIFPIGFDLEAAVKKAASDWDGKYASQLEKAIQKRALAVKLKVDTKNLDSLDAVKQRLAQLKIQPITPETKTAIRELAKELQTLAKALEQVQKFSSTNQLGQQNFRNDVALERLRQANERLEIQKRRVALAEQKHAEAMARSANTSRALSQELEKQDGYVSRLIKRLAVYAGFSQMSALLTNIRNVTAEFELQRVSLGAIIQDQQRANQLFSEIKAFALKSPLKILDLTKYTKQVAAYRIETDKLFDTTKRLADVSVGLGVDMGRLVLAYGQVKAASYLRAAEIRQFTEAGIPMLELLAEKFTELQGSAVSTEEVMDKVSKRMVTFSMVEEIFKDMTDAGGMFYNMQEKQSQTLYGMWAKMGDAAAVMYEQMGNTAVANGAMKETIQLMSDMMLHWTAFANVMQVGVIGFATYKAAMVGLIPFYNLQNMQIMNSIKAEKAHQALLLKRTSLYATLTYAQLRQLANTKKLTTAEWEEYITKTKLNQVSALRLARMAKENAALQKALINQKLYTTSQLQQIQAMSKGQYLWANIKSKVLGIGDAFKSLGMALKTYLPLATITAVIDLFMDWRQAVAAQEEAVKKVDKQYEEMKVTLMEIENAYRDVQNATKDASVSEDEFIKTSYSQKLEQLKKVIKLLGNFGMKNVIDPSVLNYTNIDPVLDKWLAKLNEVNELARGWGREVALVANAYEGNIFGWSIFGENLKEDMKDLERSWTKLTVNSEFNQSLSQLRAIVGNLANDNKAVYDNISKAIGADLKLALGQKRRNESELQYQQRIYKNYQNIESYLQAYLKKGEYKGMLPSLSSADVGDVLADFQKDVDEVMHEFDKVKEKFRDQDALSVKMAIDTIAAENDWTEWQKELLIQHLNEDPIALNAEIIPTTNVAGQGAVAEGLKAIITSEFPTLFNENELQSLVSAEGIVDAIKGKLDASNESLEKTMQLQNNLAYGSKGFENSLERVKKLQKEISDIENMRAELQTLDEKNGNLTSDELLRRSELQAKLQEVDEQSLNTKRAQIAAIVEANAKYDEQIQKQKESAKAEGDLAKAAMERVTTLLLSDLGKDVAAQFNDLRVDFDKRNDLNYSTDFLISDDELAKIRDVGDLYEMWAKNTKAIKDEKEKLVSVGITEATIEKERAALEAKRASVQADLADLERQMTDEKYAAQVAEYESLKYALATATTAEARVKAESDLQKYLGDTKNAEFAILMMEKEGLRTTLQKTLVSEQANTQIAEYLKGLEDADKLWEELGKRYNFKLIDKNKTRGGGEDPWIILMKNRMKFMQDFQKGVEDLSKWMGHTKGLADEQENMLGRGLSLKIDSRELSGTKDELIKWYEDSIGEIRKKIAKLGGKEWEGLGVQMILAKDTKSRVLKKYQELLADMFKELTDFRTEQTQKELEAKIKQLADRISRTKTAKEFYEKILGMTGDLNLAGKVSMSIYGDNGDLKALLAKQVKELTNGIELPKGIIKADNLIDYKALREFAEANRDELGKTYDELVKIAEQGQKDLAKTYEGYLKDLEKAKTYADKRIELARTTADKIISIEADIAANRIDSNVGNDIISGLRKREDKETAKLEYEAFKDMPMYVQMFDDLDNASVRTLSNMKQRLSELQSVWGSTLNPTQLKELQSRMSEIDAQLARKNPFKTLSDSIKEYKDLRIAHGSEDKLGKEIEVATKAYDEARAALTEQLEKNPQDTEAVENLRMRVDLSEEELKQLQKIADAYKKVKDAIGLSLGEVFKITNALGDLASGIGKVTSVFGGSAEDVQYWDDIANGLNEVTSGIENLVQAALSGNPISVATSAVTAIPNMISGFANLLSAGKVKRANKEIKRQQELLEQLEYTYSRLEKGAEKVFGADYISNFKQQQKILQAQARAYQAQAEAERSKGKKADEGKIAEYEAAYRDTMDKIADMQGQVAAQLLGTDLTSAARDFAKAWLDAYKEFSSTSDAMSEKFREMIENMVAESALAKVMERALKPMFDMIDNMSEQDFYSQSFWKQVVEKAEQGTKDADAGAQTMMKFLERAGISLRDTGGQLTGISRDIATASEESINGLAGHMNTVEYYVAQIHQNVAAIAVQGGESPTLSGVDYSALIQQSVDRLAMIERYSSEILVECRRNAIAAESALAEIRRVIVPRGTKGSHYVYVGM